MGIFWRNSRLTERLARLIFSQCFGSYPPDIVKWSRSALFPCSQLKQRGGVPLSAELGSSRHTSNGALDSNLFFIIACII